VPNTCRSSQATLAWSPQQFGGWPQWTCRARPRRAPPRHHPSRRRSGRSVEGTAHRPGKATPLAHPEDVDDAQRFGFLVHQDGEGALAAGAEEGMTDRCLVGPLRYGVPRGFPRAGGGVPEEGRHGLPRVGRSTRRVCVRETVEAVCHTRPSQLGGRSARTCLRGPVERPERPPRHSQDGRRRWPQPPLA
jgi:hypothetical protein